LSREFLRKNWPPPGDAGRPLVKQSNYTIEAGIVPLGGDEKVRRLSKRPAEVGEDGQGQQVDAYKRLDARDGAHPAGGSQGLLAGLHAGYPSAHVEVAPTDVEGREDGEVEGVEVGAPVARREF